MVYLKISIKISELPEFMPDILVAKLAEIGAESFEDSEEFLYAYAQKAEINQTELTEFLKQMLLSYEIDEIQPQNWNKVWEDGFKCIEIDDKVIIHAKFHEFEQKFPYAIEINPKMAFGTGHHQTTRLVIRHMLEMNFQDKSLLDFGTGTAVLAILAEKMGAKNILGIDMDEWAVNNSIENIEINHCQEIQIKQGKSTELPNEKYQIILANVNRNALLESKDALVDRLYENGELILSGLLESDIEDIRNAYEIHGLKFISVKQEDDWVAIRFSR